MQETELLNLLKDLQNGKSKPIKEYLNTYAVNDNGVVGVAVETQYVNDINEKFNNANFIKTYINRDNAKRKVIFLYANNNDLNYQFLSFCCDFLKNSELISTNPLEWYNGWIDILGNSKKNKMVYDVIAELKTLVYLNNKSKNPTWNSIDRGTFDITTSDGFYEVKASKLKTKEVITIHNQFQLDTKGLDRQLYIVYCKVEKNDSGDSIDSLYSELSSLGYNCGEVSKYLKEIGYYEGKQERYEKYLIHEMRAYKVDEYFPRIDDKSFADGKFPSNVIKIEYTISLDGLEYEKLI